MARRTIQMLVDDLDGSDAEEEVAFAVDGVQYQVDLSTKNAEAMREQLRPYIDAGRKLGRTPPLARVTTTATDSIRAAAERAKAIRSWANDKGIAVAPRGRIARTVEERFDAEAGRT